MILADGERYKKRVINDSTGTDTFYDYIFENGDICEKIIREYEKDTYINYEHAGGTYYQGERYKKKILDHEKQITIKYNIIYQGGDTADKEIINYREKITTYYNLFFKKEKILVEKKIVNKKTNQIIYHNYGNKKEIIIDTKTGEIIKEN